MRRAQPSARPRILDELEGRSRWRPSSSLSVYKYKVYFPSPFRKVKSRKIIRGRVYIHTRCVLLFRQKPVFYSRCRNYRLVCHAIKITRASCTTLAGRRRSCRHATAIDCNSNGIHSRRPWHAFAIDRRARASSGRVATRSCVATRRSVHQLFPLFNFVHLFVSSEPRRFLNRDCAASLYIGNFTYRTLRKRRSDESLSVSVSTMHRQ